MHSYSIPRAPLQRASIISFGASLAGGECRIWNRRPVTPSKMIWRRFERNKCGSRRRVYWSFINEALLSANILVMMSTVGRTPAARWRLEILAPICSIMAMNVKFPQHFLISRRRHGGASIFQWVNILWWYNRPRITMLARPDNCRCMPGYPTTLEKRPKPLMTSRKYYVKD